MSAADLSVPPGHEALAEAMEQATKHMDRERFLERVGELVRDSGGLLDPDVAALVVLDELGLAPDSEVVAPSYAKVLAPEDLEPGLDGVIVEGELLGMEPTRVFERKDGSKGFVSKARIRGEQGIYQVTLWDDPIRALVGAEPGTTVRFEGLYTKEHRDRVELHTGRDATVRLLEEDP